MLMLMKILLNIFLYIMILKVQALIQHYNGFIYQAVITMKNQMVLLLVFQKYVKLQNLKNNGLMNV